MADFLKLPRAAQKAAFAHMGDKGHGRISGTLTADKPHGRGRFAGKLNDAGRGGFKGTLPTQKRAKSLGTGERHAVLAAKAEHRPAGQKEIDDLRKAYEGGHTDAKQLSGGQSADKVEKISLSNGQVAVRKTQTPRDARSEYLAGRVANALGIKEVTVAQTGDRETVAAFVKGKPGADVLEQIPDVPGNPGAMLTALNDEIDRQTRLKNGREIGMLDWVINNDDRHEMNWMVSPDGKSVVPIDHGSADFKAQLHGMSSKPKVPTSPFVQEWIRPQRDDNDDTYVSADPQWTPAELTKVRASIEALRGEFNGPGEDSWHKFMLSRLDMLEAK
jgi:hypothetical protein